MSDSFRKKASSVLESVESAPFALGAFATAFTALIVMRIGVEQALNGFPSSDARFIFYEFSHTFLFFLVALLAFLPVVRFAGAASFTRAANLTLVGFLIIITPPIIDTWIFGSDGFWSFYEFGSITGLLERFVTFFGDTPSVGITYGVRIEVAIVMLALGAYCYIRTGRRLRALGVVILSYSVFFILGTFPSYVAMIPLGLEKGLLSVTEADIAGQMLSPQSLFTINEGGPRSSLGIRMSLVYALLAIVGAAMAFSVVSRQAFRALLRNVRPPQVVWHGGLLALGGAFAVLFAEARTDFDFFEILAIPVLVAAVESAWIASVIGNDIADRRIDAITNRKRPLPSETIPIRLYSEIGVLLFLASILLSAIVSFKLALLLLGYQAVAWLYSMPPLRLKRIPVIATFLSAVAGILILAVGYFAISPIPNVSPLPIPLIIFLIAAYTLTLPLKDFKDIEGDSADGVLTIPVLLGAERARIAIGGAIFACYGASPVILRDPTLIVPAMIFGGLSYAIVVRSGRTASGWSSFRALPGWNILLVTIYGLIAAYLLSLL